MLRPIASVVQQPPQSVSELINNTLAAWREDLVQEVFLPIDADTILKIPLCTRNIADLWAWNDDPKGRFCEIILQTHSRIKDGQRELDRRTSGEL